jgi:hypothetical protein
MVIAIVIRRATPSTLRPGAADVHSNIHKIHSFRNPALTNGTLLAWRDKRRRRDTGFVIA